LIPSVYSPDLKADWRALGEQIRLEMNSFPNLRFRVAVQSVDAHHNVEVETARYYLPVECEVIDLEDLYAAGSARPFEGRTYVAIGSKSLGGDLSPDDVRWVPDRRYPGLMVYRVDDSALPNRPPARTPADPAN
jgi:hypothetical protein